MAIPAIEALYSPAQNPPRNTTKTSPSEARRTTHMHKLATIAALYLSLPLTTSCGNQLKSANAELSAKTTKLEGDVTTLRNALEESKEQATELQEAEDRIAHLEGEAQTLRNALEESKEQAAELQEAEDRIAHLEGEAQKLRNALEAHKSEIAKLQQTEDGLANLAFDAIEDKATATALQDLDRFLAQYPNSPKYGEAAKDTREMILSRILHERIEEIRDTLPKRYLDWSQESEQEARAATQDLLSHSLPATGPAEIDQFLAEIDGLHSRLATTHFSAQLVAIQASVRKDDLPSIQRAKLRADAVANRLESLGIPRQENIALPVIAELDRAEGNYANIAAERAAKQEAEKSNAIVSDRGFKITDISTSWTTTAKGFTVADGMLWVPEVRIRAKYTGKKAADLAFQVSFTTPDGVVLDDSKDSETFQPGQTREFIITSGRGYTTDGIFAGMNKRADLFDADVFVSESYFGDYTKYRSVKVDMPPQYKRLFWED